MLRTESTNIDIYSNREIGCTLIVSSVLFLNLFFLTSSCLSDLEKFCFKQLPVDTYALDFTFISLFFKIFVNRRLGNLVSKCSHGSRQEHRFVAE